MPPASTTTRKKKSAATPLSAVQTAITTTPLVDPPTSHPIVADNVKAGDIMSITHYVKVRSIDLKQGKVFNGRDVMGVTGLDKGVKDFEVFGRTLIEGMTSADYFKEERQVSQTDAIHQLLGAGKDPFSVKYTKKEGEERILRGRYVSQDIRGYVNAIDLDLPYKESASGYDDRLRRIDTRTIEYVIVRGIKYSVKTK